MVGGQIQKDDLVTVGAKNERGFIYRIVEKLLWRLFAKVSFHPPFPSYVLCSKARINKHVTYEGIFLQRVGDETDSSDGVLYTYNDKSIHRSVRAILTLLSSITLLVPIIILFFIGKGYPALAVLIVSTSLFSVLIAVTTEGKNHELMMAAAAYVSLQSHNLAHNFTDDDSVTGL